MIHENSAVGLAITYKIEPCVLRPGAIGADILDVRGQARRRESPPAARSRDKAYRLPLCLPPPCWPPPRCWPPPPSWPPPACFSRSRCWRSRSCLSRSSCWLPPPCCPPPPSWPPCCSVLLGFRGSFGLRSVSIVPFLILITEFAVRSFRTLRLDFLFFQIGLE